jgi:hypothetical protein
MLPFLGYLKFEVLQDSVFGFYLIPNCTHYWGNLIKSVALNTFWSDYSLVYICNSDFFISSPTWPLHLWNVTDLSLNRAHDLHKPLLLMLWSVSVNSNCYNFNCWIKNFVVKKKEKCLGDYNKIQWTR